MSGSLYGERGPGRCRIQREREAPPAEAGGAARNPLLQKRTVAVQIETDQSRSYFFIFRHRVARSMPRISAARVRTPPVI